MSVWEPPREFSVSTFRSTFQKIVEAMTKGTRQSTRTLYVRDQVQRVLDDPDLPVQDRHQVSAEVSRVDQKFQAATVEDADQMLGRLLDEGVSGRRWWWCRIPTSGPIVDELRQTFG